MNARELLAEATPRPWYYDGRDIFSVAIDIVTGHRLVIPLPDTFYPPARVSEDDARLVVQAVNEYEALLRIEASLLAVVDFLGGAYKDHALAALENLNRIRRATSTP